MSKYTESFLDLEDKYSNFNKAKAVILPIPYEKTVSYGKGTAMGPLAIIDASRSIELYDDEVNCEPCDIGIHTLEQINCDFEPKKMIDKVQKICNYLLKKEKFIISLGGEHTISLGCIRSFISARYDFSVLSIDAHCDLRNEYEGRKHCHATVMRRVVEQGIPIVEVGIRSYSKEESEFITNSENTMILKADEIHNSGKDIWQSRVLSNLKDRVYLSIDVDGFDPSIISTTGTPEPGGLSWQQVLTLLKKLFLQKEVIGMDVVELSPVKGFHGPNVLTAKLIYKSIGYKFFLE